MKNILKLTLAPLISLFIFIIGNGLFTTLLTVRLHSEGVNVILIGAMTGFYYIGLALGSFKIEHFILSIGHIRAFAASASFLAVVCFLQGVLVNPWIWLMLRFLGGLATAGVFIVIESWLLSVGEINIRGQILSLYMIFLYGGQALGQFLINISNPNTVMLFAVTAILSSMSVIPVALTKIPAPELSEPSLLKFKELFKISGSGLFGSFCSGLIISTIYGLLPLVITQNMHGTKYLSILMFLTITGGVFLQYPVGKISDYIERRTVLTCIAIATAIVSSIIIFSLVNFYTTCIILFVLGGLTFTLYPVSVSHACDNLVNEDIIPGTQGLLLVYGIGASIGPFVAPIFIHFMGPSGLFIYFITISSILSLFLVWRKIFVPSVPREDNFVALPQTTPVTAEMDPRVETEGNEQ